MEYVVRCSCSRRVYLNEQFDHLLPESFTSPVEYRPSFSRPSDDIENAEILKTRTKRIPVPTQRSNSANVIGPVFIQSSSLPSHMHTHTAVSPTSKQKQAVDITNTSEFIAFQNVFEEQLSAKIPWCPVCLKKSQSSLSETLVRCFKQRKVETEKLEELQTLSEIIDSEIRAEEEQLKQLESDILFLHEKNSLVVYVYSELCNDLRLFRTTSSTHFSQIACLEKVVLKSSVVPDLSLLNLQIERLQNDRRIWGDIFEVSWTDGGVTICGVNPVESIKAKNYTEVQASFGMIISLIKKVAFYSGAFLQKTCIDGFGYGGFVVNHTDFSNVSRSKFKNGLKGVLVAFEEVSTFLSETTNFELPFPITKSEYFQIYSFTDTSNLDQWAVALKFFVSDLGYMFSYVFFN